MANISALGIAALVLLGALPGGASGQTASLPADPRFDGEYALYVRDRGDSVEVRWMTATDDSGAIQVLARNKLIWRATTPPGQVHGAVFARPKARSTELSLRYGSGPDTGRLHTTNLSLEPRPVRPPSTMAAAESVFVVGDVHGEFNSLRTMLHNSGVVDANGEWSAGRAHLVFVGDLFDRGSDVTPLLWFLYRLERNARRKGGSVDVVLGNHEIMTWTGDTRYVAPREDHVARAYGKTYAELFDLEETVLGRWLASKPGILKIGDAVMVHGGITPAFAQIPISRFNDAMQTYFHQPMFRQLLADSAVTARFDSTAYHHRLTFFFAPESPFWYRGYVQSDTLEAQLDAVLAAYQAKLLVVGHTPVPAITGLYRGKLIATNVQAFGTEMLLLIRDPAGSYRRYRIDIHGRVEDL